MRSQNRPSFTGLGVRELIVSGFVTSPLDHERICFEDASPISIASELLMSITGVPFLLVAGGGGGGVLDVLSVGRVGVGGHAGRALLDLFLLGLVGRGIAVALPGADAGEVDAQLLR